MRLRHPRRRLEKEQQPSRPISAIIFNRNSNDTDLYHRDLCIPTYGTMNHDSTVNEFRSKVKQYAADYFSTHNYGRIWDHEAISSNRDSETPILLPAPSPQAPAPSNLGTRMPKGIGNLEKLPPEVRTEILKRVLPAGFHQVYPIKDSKFTYSGEESSREPQYFRASEQLRQEMIVASNVDSEHNITVDLHEIRTDFIAGYSQDRATTPTFDASMVTACRMLNIKVKRPSPRTATAFAQIRSNVHDLIDRLNQARCEILPRLTIQLEFSHAIDSGWCAYSDFSILMAPFCRLEKFCRAQLMFRTTGSTIFSPRIEEQCNLLESSMNGGIIERQILKFQQCNVEIKIGLLLKSWEHETSISSAQYAHLRDKANSRIVPACRELRAWYKTNAIALPDWISEVEDLAMNRRISQASNDLLTRVMGRTRDDYHAWTLLRSWFSGHYKGVNPCWDENLCPVPDLQESNY